VAIDQVSKGILLSHDLHARFGQLNLYFEPVEEGAVSDKSYPELCVRADSYQGCGDTYQPKLSKRTTHNRWFQLPTTITFQNKDLIIHSHRANC
jgi:hypothetical protein